MTKPRPPIDLSSPELYFHRELSALEFQRRVLAQATDVEVPLLERLRFLTIVSSNLDEFMEVRVAGLQERLQLDIDTPGPDGLDAEQSLTHVSRVAHALVEQQYRILNDDLLPALHDIGIRLLRRSEWSKDQKQWVRTYFKTQVLPLLSPVALDTAHPFPNVQNKSLNFIIRLSGKDAFGRTTGHAILKVPRSLPRVVKLPSETGGVEDYAMISSIIHANVGRLFPGMEVESCYQFRVTRNSNLWVDEEEVGDLRAALKGELHGRLYGRSVRLEVADNCDEDTVVFLAKQHAVDFDRDVYRVPGPVNLHRLDALVTLTSRPALKYPRHTSRDPLPPKASVLSTLNARSMLLHHPFESYSPVVRMVWEAARDPKVLTIKQTLYRTGQESPIVEALVHAARMGKEVTAVIELRARFDEAANIRITNRLQEAGASVVYGVVGHKCHAKMLLIVRREGSGLRRYVHLGTGNYHTGNARAYTDYSLFTAEPSITEDTHALFMEMSALGRVPKMKKLLHSPFSLKQNLSDLIRAEAQNAAEGKPAWIRFKCNAITKASIVRDLYRASQQGVPIELVVRGICRLRPEVPGVSENIRVSSVVGRFLEHSRVYAFCNGGDPLVYCASADLMTRNLDRRVEACFPIEDPQQRARVLDELDLYLQDGTAWQLQSDGQYVRCDSDLPSAQSELVSRFAR